jgi:hypothetical protein
MPAKSEKQQVAARIAHAIKKGKVKPKKGTASAQMAKGMSDKQIKHFMVREGDYGSFGYEPPGQPGVLSRGAGPSPEAPSQASNYRGHEIRIYRYSDKAFEASIDGKPRITRNSPFEAVRDAKRIIDKQFMVREDDGGPGTTSVNIGGGPPTVNPGKKKSKLPPAFLRNIKKKKDGEKEKKEESAAFQRVMNLVYAEEARLQKLT